MISRIRLTAVANLTQGFITRSTVRRFGGVVPGSSWGNNNNKNKNNIPIDTRFDPMRPFLGVVETPSISRKESCAETDEMLETLFSRNMALLSLSHNHAASAGTTTPGSLPSFLLQNVNQGVTMDNEEAGEVPESYEMMNRNARKPKKSNKGARPCSRAGRRKKKEKFGKRKR